MTADNAWELAGVLSWWLGIAALAVGLGRAVLHRAGLGRLPATEAAAFSGAIGLAAVAYGMVVLAAAQRLSPAGAAGVLAVLAPLAAWGWTRPVSRTGPDGAPAADDRRLPWVRGVAVFLLAALLAADFLLALTPAVGNDSLSYHLAVPRRYLENGGFTDIPGNIFASYPLLTEMLYAAALAVHGEVLAKALHFLYFLLVLASAAALAARHLPRFRLTPVALLLFASVPTAFLNAHLAYNDMAMTAYTLLGFAAYLNWRSTALRGWLWICGALAGMAMSVKYAGLFLPFVGVLGIFWAYRGQGSAQAALKDAAVFLVTAALLGCPFYVKNALLTGNPLYPFFIRIFGGDGWDPKQAQLYALFLDRLGVGRSLLDYLLLPVNVSLRAQMHSPRFDGVLGPAFLFLLPFLAGLRPLPHAVKSGLCFSLLLFLFWASTAQQIRYLLPIVPVLSLAAAYALDGYRSRRVPFVLLLLLTGAGILYNARHVVEDFRSVRPLPVVTGQESRDDFLQRRIPSYPVYRYINEQLPDTASVFLVYMKNLGYLCRRSCYSDSIFESYTLGKILRDAGDEREVRDRILQMGFTHIAYDEPFAVGAYSVWEPSEVETFERFRDRFLIAEFEAYGRYFLFRIRSGAASTSARSGALPGTVLPR